jgi:hypothetical protein
MEMTDMKSIRNLTTLLASCVLCAMTALVFVPAAGAQPPSDLPAADAAAPSLAARAADHYRAQARFPEHSRPVAAGADDPVLARRVPQKVTVRPRGGAAGPSLVLWSSATSFEAPEPAVLHASLEGPGRSVAARGGEAFVTGEVVGAAGDTVTQVVYRDDGVAPDARAKDGVYTAAVELPAGRTPDVAESFLVQVLASPPGDGETIHGSGGFLYTDPRGRLAGEFTDRLEAGSVVVGARVEVSEAGRFHLEGVLHSMKGEPLAWAQTALDLEPGSHWLELEFYGLALSERGVAGPYRLGSVSLSTTGVMPNALGTVVENAHRTRAYPLSQLSREPFGAPGLLEAAERLDRRGGR